MVEYILAIETGGTKIQLVLGTKQGDIIYRYRTKVEREKGGAGILTQILEAFPIIKNKADEYGGIIWRIGIGFGGPVETSSGKAIWSAQIDGWKNFPVSDFIEKNTGIKTYIFNDTNAAAWGEYCKGTGKNSKVFFYTNIGSGVGGGLVLDGKLFDGQGKGAAEFGQSYMYDPYASDGIKHPFNHVEKICSGWSIQERIRKDKIPQSSILWKLCEQKQEILTCEMWAEGIRQNDEYSLKILHEVSQWFAIALCNVICFYSPEIIAIGGGVSLIGDPLIECIKQYVDKYVYINNIGCYKIIKSYLDEDVVIVGTLLLTAEQ